MDGLAEQVHPHAGADGGDIPGAQQPDDLLQALDDHVPVDDDLMVFAAQIIGGLAGIFQVDGIGVHADGKGADGLAQLLGCNGADQRGIQTAREQEAHRGIGIQTLFHACDQLFADVPQGSLHVILHGGGHVGNVLIADKAAIAVVAADGEGADVVAPADQVLHLGGKGDLVAGLGIAVEQRTDADGVAGCDQPVLAGIIQNKRKLGVHMAEHIQTVLVIQRQQDLAVAVGGKLVAPALQDLLLKAEAVELTVADHAVGTAVEGLHPLRGQAHDGKAAKAHQTKRPFHHTLIVRPAHHGAQQILLEFGGTQVVPRVTHNTTHISYPSLSKPLRQCFALPPLLIGEASFPVTERFLQIKKYGSLHPIARTNAAVSVVPPKLPVREHTSHFCVLSPLKALPR